MTKDGARKGNESIELKTSSSESERDPVDYTRQGEKSRADAQEKLRRARGEA